MQNAHQKCPFASAVLATDAVANALSNVHGYSVSQLHVKNLKCARGQDDTPAAGVGTVRDYQAKFGYEHIISALEYQREALSKPQGMAYEDRATVRVHVQYTYTCNSSDI
eukprot:31501-Pelagococcus_subviridis.AAC.6